MLLFSAVFDPPTCGNAVTATRLMRILQPLPCCTTVHAISATPFLPPTGATVDSASNNLPCKRQQGTAQSHQHGAPDNQVADGAGADVPCILLDHRTLDNEWTSGTLSGENDGRWQSTVVFVALHAIKGTRCLTDGRGCQRVAAPGTVRVLVLGGTDVSDAEDDDAARAQLVARLDIFHAVVAFTHHMARRITAWAPHVVPRLHVIPPAVPDRLVALRSLPVSVDAAAWARSLPDLATNQPFLALPTGLRAVKDPLFLLSAFSSWYQRQGEATRPRLLVFGVARPDVPTSGSFAATVADCVRDCDGVSLVPPISPTLFTEVLRLPTCRGLVNCSLAEGASNAILEAMALGVPVLARRIPGNVALLGDEGKAGWLYDTPSDFLSCLEQLRADGGQQRTVTEALRRINEHHREAQEGVQYRKLVDSLVRRGSDVPAVKEWWTSGRVENDDQPEW